ncbi:MAG: hypothetical protein U0Z44_17165 [Kouleothrix sp.]
MPTTGCRLDPAPNVRQVILDMGVMMLVGLALGACSLDSFANQPTPAPIVVTVLVTAAPTAEAPTVAAVAPTEPAAPTPTPEAAPTAAPSATPDVAPTPTLEPLISNAPPTPTLEPLISNTIPTDTIYGDELAFQVLANDPAAGPNNGDGIASVTFQVYGPGGELVYERTERNALYCAFGGGDNGQDCNVWRFSEHGNQWPGGAALEDGASYRLATTTRSQSGQIATQELEFTIQLGQ